jgi:cyanophycinase-like exopeptidase
MNGSLALVGSGEYLPAMAAFEKSLLDDGIKNGKQSAYVQIPTAAGRESQDSLNYWKNLGQQQAKRIGVPPIFLPIYTRDDAFKQEHVDAIKNSALMYMSGGDPHHLAEVLIDTPVWSAMLEMTAIVRRSGNDHWVVVGDAKVHVLKGLPDQQLHDGQEIKLSLS